MNRKRKKRNRRDNRYSFEEIANSTPKSKERTTDCSKFCGFEERITFGHIGFF